jgi:Undecaprenyl-phosphate galactose phosphotransferase WbaP
MHTAPFNAYLPSFPGVRFPSKWLTRASFVAADLIMLLIASCFPATAFVWLGHGPAKPDMVFLPVFATLVAFSGAQLFQCTWLPAGEERRRILFGVIAGYLSVGLLEMLTHAPRWSMVSVVIGIIISAVLVVLARSVLRTLCCSTSWWGTPAVVVGSPEAARDAVALLEHYRVHGFRAVAILTDTEAEPIVPGLFQAPVYCGVAVAESHRVSHAIVVGTKTHDTNAVGCREELACFSHILTMNVAAAAEFYDRAEIANAGLPGTGSLVHVIGLAVKRVIDVALTVIIFLVIIPLFVLLTIAVAQSSRGPVFYSQRRIGKGGGQIRAWKFRSMYPDAEALLHHYLEADPQLREEWEQDRKLRNDPRVTPIGRILRKTSLDELPQLWNVLCGEMSLVGPRPIVSAEIEKYGDCYYHYQSVHPGITGLWQVSGRNNTTYAERVQFDKYYAENWSLWLDFRILCRTFKTVLLREGAY